MRQSFTLAPSLLLPCANCRKSNSALAFKRVARLLRVALLVFLCHLSSVNLWAQLTTAEEKGLPPNSVFHVGDVDMVNLENGNLHISIPIASIKQRGGGVAEWKLLYDSPTWTKAFFLDNCPPVQYPIIHNPDIDATKQQIKPCPTTGFYAVTESQSFDTNWRFTTPVNWDYEFTDNQPACPIEIPIGEAQSGATITATYQNEYKSNWYAYDPEGTAHPLALRVENFQTGQGGNPTCLGSSLKAPSLDGSGLMLDVSATGDVAVGGTLYEKDGKQTTTDLNHSRDANGNLATLQADTLGRSGVVVTYDPAYQPTNPSSVPQYTIYTVTNSNGQPEQYRVDYITVNLLSAICSQSGLVNPPNQSFKCSEAGAPVQEIKSITLPSGRKYLFTYNDQSPGELAEIDLPTGASIKYTYTDFYELSLASKGLQSGTVGGRAVASRTVTVDGVTHTWTYTPTPSGNTVSAPDGTSEVHSFTKLTACEGPDCHQSGSSYETSVAYLDGNGKTLRTIATDYASELSAPDLLVANVRPIRTTTTLSNGLVSKKETDFDSFPYTSIGVLAQLVATRMNPTEVREYGFGVGAPGPLIRKTDYTYLHDSSAGYADLNIVDKPASVTIYDGAGNQESQVTYEYDNYARPNQPMKQSGAVQHDSSYSTNYLTRGNLTGTSHWNNVDGSFITTQNQYDDAGNVTMTTDPQGNSTLISYADSWADKTCAPSGGNSALLPTAITNALGQISTSTYNSCTGSRAASTDANHQTTSFSYGMYDRQTRTDFPDHSWSATCFSDDLNGGCSGSGTLLMESTHSGTARSDFSYADGLGRIKQTQTQGGAQTIYGDYVYDGVGRLFSRSNPYYSTSDPGYGVSTQIYDVLGRPTVATSPDGGVRSWTYDGLMANTIASVSTQTDELSNSTSYLNDALGRVVGVIEPGALSTAYSFDTLGNLIGVNQVGNSGERARVRAFSYDSLSRLITSQNPESGTICYGTWNAGSCQEGYDGNGNLGTKTDARGVQTTYSYDALNRLTRKQYSDGTTLAGFGYDGNSEAGIPLSQFGITSANSIGRLSGVSNQVNAATWQSYDSMGRPVLQSECLPSDCYYGFHVAATYDLAGNMTSLTYPDGRTVAQAFDSAGRLATVGDGTNTQAYLQATAYHADGSPEHLTLGNGIIQTWQQNNRLQVAGLTVSDGITGANYLSHTYCYVNCPSGGTANNGNIWQITDNNNPTRTQAFTYDNLNRISSFALGGVPTQQYAIDSFGNLSGLVNGQPTSTFDPATNRISNLPCAASVQPYDAAGNQLCDTDQNGAISQYTFDAESRISQINTLGNAAAPFVAYIYGADGARVHKQNADGTFTEYVDFNGQPIAEKDQTGAWTDYVFAGGKRIATVRPADYLIHFSGSNPQGGIECGTRFNLTSGYPIQSGDKLHWRENKQGAVGGLNLYTDTTGLQWQYADTDGITVNQDGRQGWVNRTIDLSPFAGHPIYTFEFLKDVDTPAGSWDIWYGDLVVVSTDGTVTQMFTRGMTPAMTAGACQGPTSGPIVGEVQAVATAPLANPAGVVTYTLADHLGSAQMEFASGGYPVATSQFMPFGGEINPPVTANHYKFTGKERDQESGLDYFGARYHGSNMGRFMSPDWSLVPTPIPFATLDNPQSLNLYSYVGNNPIRSRDADGHHQECGADTSSTGKDGTVTVTSHCYEVSDGILGGIGSLFAAFNPWGKLGGPAHRATVNRLAEMLRKSGYEVQTEVKIPTEMGEKSSRYVDVLGVKKSTGETKMYQVGNTNKDGSPIAREVRAMNDIEKATGLRPQFESKDLASQIDNVEMNMHTNPIGEAGPMEGEPVEPIEPIELPF